MTLQNEEINYQWDLINAYNINARGILAIYIYTHISMYAREIK